MGKYWRIPIGISVKPIKAETIKAIADVRPVPRSRPILPKPPAG
jgi:hypothetical protein